MTRIAHISDIHFGRIKHPSIVQALIDDINDAEADLVVVSGDLTQRAFGHQFRAARRMLDAFDAPTLVVPGNHDVFPWWRILSRLFDPLRRYRKLIQPNLAPRWKGDGVIVQGINSAFGWSIQGGRITDLELQQIEDGFTDALKDDFRVLVVHHHLAELEELGDHDLSRGAQKAFDTAHAAGVGLILCGHLHQSHVAHVSVHEGARPIIVATSGTSTSSRARGEDRSANFYNQIQITPEQITVEERRFLSEVVQFSTTSIRQFAR